MKLEELKKHEGVFRGLTVEGSKDGEGTEKRKGKRGAPLRSFYESGELCLIWVQLGAGGEPPKIGVLLLCRF